MSHTPHELAEEFPESREAISRLKVEDAHFARLCEEYHEANRTIHRMEAGVEPASAVRETELRKVRMRLKDEIFAILSRAEA